MGRQGTTVTVGVRQPAACGRGAREDDGHHRHSRPLGPCLVSKQQHFFEIFGTNGHSPNTAMYGRWATDGAGE